MRTERDDRRRWLTLENELDEEVAGGTKRSRITLSKSAFKSDAKLVELRWYLLSG